MIKGLKHVSYWGSEWHESIKEKPRGADIHDEQADSSGLSCGCHTVPKWTHKVERGCKMLPLAQNNVKVVVRQNYVWTPVHHWWNKGRVETHKYSDVQNGAVLFVPDGAGTVSMANLKQVLWLPFLICQNNCNCFELFLFSEKSKCNFLFELQKKFFPPPNFYVNFWRLVHIQGGFHPNSVYLVSFRLIILKQHSSLDQLVSAFCHLKTSAVWVVDEWR